MTTEKLATQLLKRAVELDYQKRLEPSLACYEEGIVLLMKAHKSKSLNLNISKIYFGLLSNIL